MSTRRYSSLFLAVLALLALSAPVRLEAAPPGPKWLSGFPIRAGNSIILMWTPIPGATGYRLFRKMGDAPFKEIYSGPANTYSDTSVALPDTVTYKVAGMMKDGESETSAPGTVKGIEQMQPPSFTGAIGSTTAITVRWSSPQGTMFSNIYRAESENGAYMLQESVQIETFTDRKVEKGTTYFYRIASVGKDGKESPWSAPIRASLRRSQAESAGTAEKTIPRKLAARGFFRGEEIYELNQPSIAGLTHDRELYVLERRGIQFFDADGIYKSRITFDKGWGLPGSVVEDGDGTLLVPFFSEQVIRRLDRTGKLVGELRYPPYVDRKIAPPNKKKGPAEPADVEPPEGTAQKAPRFRNNPNQVAVDGTGYYWILDGVRAQAIKINGKGDEIATVGRPPGTYDEREMTESDLPTAKGIQYNPVDGKLYVVLGVTAQIKVIDPKKAAVVATFGGLGTTNAKFQGIGGLAFRKNGNILVLDHLMQAIKEFDPAYKYVATYVDVIERDTMKLSSNLLSNFAFDENDLRFYITSVMGNRVYKFDILPTSRPAAIQPGMPVPKPGKK
ncbi:MAG TPA: hypothetical protein VGK27_10610 [Candidatus Deferrimicrobiaceae bacterium]|jgi:hypothetical protein